MHWLFEKFGKYIYMKAMHLQRSSENLNKYQVLMAKIKEFTTSDEIKPYLKELEALEETIMEDDKPLSFKSYSKEVQERYHLAVDYADLFVDVTKTNGDVVASLAAYYLCRCTHGTETPCNTIILSKEWTRRYHETALKKKGQCWYCNICGTQFRSSFGMLIEIFCADETYYMRAPVKPFDVIDLVALKLEETLDGKSPEELYDSLPPQKMRETNKVRKAGVCDFWRKGVDKNMEGVYKVDEEFYKCLTPWGWFDIVTFTNVDPQTGLFYSKKGRVTKTSELQRCV
jgi:hypothetical protein